MTAAPNTPTPAELVECPRDAMQGLHDWVPTEQKVAYLNALLQVGFTVLDFGSFVSPKAIPQLRDTREVVPQLQLEGVDTQLLAIVLNERGATDALEFPEIALLGFPYSINETFSLRNGNQTSAQAWEKVLRIQELATAQNRELVVYLSMAFGNPYGDEWNVEQVLEAADRVQQAGIRYISVADTVGTAQPEVVEQVFTHLIHAYSQVTFSAHLHANPRTWRPKAEAAWNGGCRRLEGALQGYGGCPFAGDELVGNLATENWLALLEEKGALPQLNTEALRHAQELVPGVFGR